MGGRGGGGSWFRMRETPARCRRFRRFDRGTGLGARPGVKARVWRSGISSANGANEKKPHAERAEGHGEKPGAWNSNRLAVLRVPPRSPREPVVFSLQGVVAGFGAG